MLTRLERANIELARAYSGLANLWADRANSAMEENQAWEVYTSIKNQIACEAKARQIRTRYAISQEDIY